MLEKEYNLIINYDKCHKGQSFSKTLLAVLTYILSYVDSEMLVWI